MKKRKYFELAGCILGCAIIAILVHALLPSPGGTMAVEEFDSLLVKTVGFPVVASLYFVILYVHIVFALLYLGSHSSLDSKSIGIRCGIVFAALYMVGMQEVVVSAPFTSWGMDFVLYQFFMGLGDAIPAFILCFVMGLFFIKSKGKERVNTAGSARKVALIAAIVFAERMIGQATGIISSDINVYPMAVCLWTLLFGLVMGIAYVILEPAFKAQRKWFSIILVIGLNWIWFNCFIGLIMAGLIGQMLLRGILDVMALTFGVLIVDKFWGGDLR